MALSRFNQANASGISQSTPRVSSMRGLGTRTFSDANISVPWKSHRRFSRVRVVINFTRFSLAVARWSSFDDQELKNPSPEIKRQEAEFCSCTSKPIIDSWWNHDALLTLWITSAMRNNFNTLSFLKYREPVSFGCRVIVFYLSESCSISFTAR